MTADTTGTSVAIATPDLNITAGQITTTSLQIAEHFGKRHADVIRTIRNLSEDLGADWYERNFAFIQKTTDLGKGRSRKDPVCAITRDGFTLLAMGFTGKEAMQWKVAYLTAFNKMEQELLARTTRPANPAIDYERISPAQAQDLKEIVDAIVRAGVQGHGETWSRLHKKFRVNSYLQLAATRHAEARQYLIAKLPVGFVNSVANGGRAASAIHDQVAQWVVQLEAGDTALTEAFMPIYRAVRKQVERPGTLSVDRRKLAAIWVDLGKLKSRVDGLGVMESDLPPSWWAANAISQ